MAVLERKEAKKVIKNFFDAYLHKRDLETALSFVCIFLYGPGFLRDGEPRGTLLFFLYSYSTSRR